MKYLARHTEIRARLDLKLWMAVARARVSRSTPEPLRTRTITLNVARHSWLMMQSDKKVEPHQAFDPEARLLNPEKEAVLREALTRIYPPGYLETDDGKHVAEVEIQSRQFWFKARYVPWILTMTPLCGARVLEIGAGTGTSSVPLAEKGAFVDSIDINGPGLEVAKLRSELHGLGERINFRCANANEIRGVFGGNDYDLIVYFASLEHMTYEERVISLRDAWSMLPSGAFLSVCDTPNRLWYYDGHTAFTNFFHWLPDEVAIDYASRTPRAGFNTEFRSRENDPVTRLARWGRGVSYHEFEIATGERVEDLTVSGEWQYRRNTSPEWARQWMQSEAGQFHTMLRALAPKIPAAFLEEELALMMRKP